MNPGSGERTGDAIAQGVVELLEPSVEREAEAFLSTSGVVSPKSGSSLSYSAQVRDGKESGESVVVVIRLPEELAKEVPHKEDDTSPAHITVLYLNDLEEGDFEKFEESIRRVCRETQPLELKLGQGVSYFRNQKDQIIAHKTVPSKGLRLLNHELVESVEDEGIEVKQFDNGYKGHVTLAYLDEKNYDGSVPEGFFEASAVEIWGLYPEPVVIPLGAQLAVATNGTNSREASPILPALGLMTSLMTSSPGPSDGLRSLAPTETSSTSSTSGARSGPNISTSPTEAGSLREAPVVVTPTERQAEKRGLRYKQLVEQASAKHGIDPALLDAVIWTESKYKPEAVSGAGGQGLMQLTPITQTELKVKDPHNPRESINAGASYLADLLRRFDHDIDMALASYNAGPGTVRKYKGVPPFKETRDYLVRVKDRMLKSPFKKDAGLAKRTTMTTTSKQAFDMGFTLESDKNPGLLLPPGPEEKGTAVHSGVAHFEHENGEHRFVWYQDNYPKAAIIVKPKRRWKGKSSGTVVKCHVDKSVKGQGILDKLTDKAHEIFRYLDISTIQKVEPSATVESEEGALEPFVVRATSFVTFESLQMGAMFMVPWMAKQGVLMKANDWVAVAKDKKCYTIKSNERVMPLASTKSAEIVEKQAGIAETWAGLLGR